MYILYENDVEWTTEYLWTPEVNPMSSVLVNKKYYLKHSYYYLWK